MMSHAVMQMRDKKREGKIFGEEALREVHNIFTASFNFIMGTYSTKSRANC